ncbi:hypothetical protein TEA_009871 [Camellia sinensis var. sinensis]|uniref:MaoC-like domain-containing protein n=1 Tax=Camellia sinensis var. sinensis TaxID=542762 RepID=A0A4V6RYL1_CAMSN|nr:hypothetical protein TEA_009871 [Camellia sinensis var. sinensis]
MLMKRVVSSFIPSLGFSSLSASIVKSEDVLKQARIFSSSDVLEYSKLRHDLNPLHFDIEIARNAGFEDRLVHGMLVASLFPRIIASHFVQHTEIEVSLNSFRSEKQYQHRILWENLIHVSLRSNRAVLFESCLYLIYIVPDQIQDSIIHFQNSETQQRRF